MFVVTLIYMGNEGKNCKILSVASKDAVFCFFGGVNCKETIILSYLWFSCFLPFFLFGGGRADKSCFDAGAVRG